jgi:hypothetical protein
MADIEGHTIIYLRELLATRAIDDPTVAEFLACWFYEETCHARMLAQFLSAAGHAMAPRRRSAQPLRVRLEARGIAWVSNLWHDFVAVHMTWGAINELTTLTSYKRLSELAPHPVLDQILAAVRRDEARHFGVYYAQAERRLTDAPLTRRVARTLVERFWDPVGSGVRPTADTHFLGAYLFNGPEGREAARTIDRTIRRLPGFDDVPLLEVWLDRHTGAAVDSSQSVAHAS